jgi:hypothetical protein
MIPPALGILLVLGQIVAIGFLAKTLLQKEPKPEKTYDIPSSFMRINFTNPSSKLPIGGNLGKQIVYTEDGEEKSFPYHPLIVGLYSYFKSLPYLDETLGQDTIPEPVIGEINAEPPKA